MSGEPVGESRRSPTPVLRERLDRVLLITLNRPEARNAINRAAAEALGAALDELDDDDELRVGVLTGAGSGFSAGMDLKAFVKGENISVGKRGPLGILGRPPRKPLVAAVEGFAVAGGLEIALACDLIVAARHARLGLPEVTRGLVAAAALRRMPQRVGHGATLELALTGTVITGQRAYEMRLVERVAEDGDALRTAVELATTIARAAPLAVVASKELLRRQRDWPEEEYWTRQAEITAPVAASEDAREGAVAFADKRVAAWRGR